MELARGDGIVDDPSVELHPCLKGFEALGANIEVANGKVIARAEKLVGAPIYMDTVSVGATINIMLAAVLAEGTTTIDNAAKEPHIVDVANFLNSLGADIRGAGTDLIKVNGVKSLKSGSSYSVVPDQIEAGTFMLAAVASQGDIILKNCVSEHLDCLTAKIIEIGGHVEDTGDEIRVWCNKRPTKTNIKTAPYPGFPTDLQAQMGVVLSIADAIPVGFTADGLPLLVNRDSPLPDDYQPQQLVNMRDYCDSSIVSIKGSEIEGEQIAVDALLAMLMQAQSEFRFRCGCVQVGTGLW